MIDKVFTNENDEELVDTVRWKEYGIVDSI